MSRRWGLIGFGEAGRTIGGAVAASGVDLAVHDRMLLDPARGAAVREAVAAAARPRSTTSRSSPIATSSSPWSRRRRRFPRRGGSRRTRPTASSTST